MGLEVYLLRRSHKSSFMPGLYVFPGGALEPWDEEAELPEKAWDEPYQRVLERLGEGLTPQQARAHLVAAIRETFEEVGILLAEQDGRKPQGNLLKGLDRQARAFRHLLFSQGTRLQASRFSCWAHWITPEGMPRRFDTRFYLALHPEEQICLPDQVETSRGLWITPQGAILKNHEGSIPLSPPTLVTLQELSVFRSIEELRREAWERGWGPTRLPKATKTPWGPMLLMPWDPYYSSQEPPRDLEGRSPKYVEPLEPFSRLIQEKGVWRPLTP